MWPMIDTKKYPSAVLLDLMSPWPRVRNQSNATEEIFHYSEILSYHRLSRSANVQSISLLIVVASRECVERLPGSLRHRGNEPPFNRPIWGGARPRNRCVVYVSFVLSLHIIVSLLCRFVPEPAKPNQLLPTCAKEIFQRKSFGNWRFVPTVSSSNDSEYRY